MLYECISCEISENLWIPAGVKRLPRDSYLQALFGETVFRPHRPPCYVRDDVVRSSQDSTNTGTGAPAVSVNVTQAITDSAAKLYRSPFTNDQPSRTNRSTSRSSNASSTGTHCSVTGINDSPEIIGKPA